MRSLALRFATTSVAIAMSACNQAPPSSTAQTDAHQADVKALNDVEAKVNSDLAAKDLDGLVGFYAEGATLMTPGMDPWKGKDAIKAGLQQMLADKAFSLTLNPNKVDVARSGDLGYTQGEYQMTATDPATHKPVKDHGTYVIAYRKQSDGSWKAVADIGTSSLPPEPQKH